MAAELKYCGYGYADALADLRAGRVFSLARYGDGEKHWILGDRLTNCDGHRAFLDGSAALRLSLTRWRDNPPARLFCSLANVPNLKRPDGSDHPWARLDRRFAGWLDDEGLATRLNWVKSHFFLGAHHEAIAAGAELELVSALRGLPVVLVGPLHLMYPLPLRGRLPSKPLSDTFPVQHFIPVNQRDCWLDYERVKIAMLDAHRMNTKRPLVFLLSASFLAKVLISELYRTIGQDCFLIDTGSLWEPFVGLAIRDYQHELVAHDD